MNNPDAYARLHAHVELLKERIARKRAARQSTAADEVELRATRRKQLAMDIKARRKGIAA